MLMFFVYKQNMIDLSQMLTRVINLLEVNLVKVKGYKLR